MRLTDADKAKLDGQEGPAVQEAMAYLVKLGEAFEAQEMVDVDSVHLLSDWMLMGEAGLGLYQKFAGLGAKIRVHSSTEPLPFDLDRWQEFNLPGEFYAKQVQIIAALKRMGTVLTFSNIFYFSENVPKFGDILAWMEGNATGWANSVAGARGNRESPITCLMAGISGRMPRYGLLCDENRRPQMIIELEPGAAEALGGDGGTSADFSSLGMVIGDLAYDRIPAVVGLPPRLKNEQLKAICSMCSPALTTTLILMVGISPEAPTLEAAFGGRVPAGVERRRIGLSDLRAAYEHLSRAPRPQIDGVLTGCPYKTVYELQELADLLDGRRVKEGVFFIVYTDRTNWEMARQSGLVDRIERSGARVYHDACPVMIPMDRLYGPDKVFASDSMKMVRLIRGMGKPSFLFGTLKDLVEAASTGLFRSTRW
jgi:predicted aconitase